MSQSSITLERPAQQVRPRMDWVDRLRVWLTILVVAHHCAATYASIQVWYVNLGTAKDPWSTALTMFLVTNQLWFMGAFFLLSGLFVPGSADRKGTGRFVRDRLLRLGIPLLGYVVVVRPIALLPAAISMARSTPHFSALRFVLFGGDPGVTWFLEVLIVFSLGYALIRAIRRTTEALVRQERPRFRGLLALAGVLAVAMFGWLLVCPMGTYWPVVGLPSPTFLPQYLMLFVVGIVAAKRGWLTSMPGWWAAPAAAGLLAGVACAAATVGSPTSPAHPVTAAVLGLGITLFSLSAIVLLVVVFRRWLARPAGRFTRFVSQQAFAVYLTHPIVLVWVAVALLGVPGPAILRFGLLFVLAVPLCWLAAWALRRIPAVRRII